MVLDDEFAAKIRNKDPVALREIVIRHQDHIARTIVAFLGPCPEVDDVGQEVFLRFFRAAHRFRGDCSVGTYLTRIAINACKDELRRRRNAREMLAPLSAQIAAAPGTDLEGRADVRRALDRLHFRFRSVLLLRYFGGLSVEETGVALGIPTGTVLSRLHRARRKLGELLSRDQQGQKGKPKDG